MSWGALLVLAAGAYAFKAAGPLVLGGREIPARLAPVLALLLIPLLAALVAVQTLAEGERLVVDARAAGVAIAALAVLARAPFLGVLLAASATAAAVRAAA